MAGDFNGDGRTDLAIADQGDLDIDDGGTDPGGVSVLLGNGDGTFQDQVTYAAGDHPYALVAGDFNGDGRTDLAVANFYDHDVCLLVRSNPLCSRFFKIMASSDNIDLSAFRLHEKDTGSADVQIALLTRRINQLTDHLKIFRKDHSSRRGLLKLVATRRSMLDYLKRTSQDRYKSVIEKLNLRK